MINCLNGDCLELMKSLPDKSVDLFVCDLPYGCLNAGGGKEHQKRVAAGNQGVHSGVCKWDVKIDLEKFWVEVKRLCKNQNTPVLMFCNTLFGIDLINSNRDWFRYDIVWNKNCGTNFLNANKQPMKSHEMIYVFSKKSAFYNRVDVEVEGKGPYTQSNGGNSITYGKKEKNITTINIDGKRCVLSVVNFGRIQDKRHPTAKPVDLLKWLIERYSNEGDVVLDPTAGSFNSGRAAVELNRSYIGIEMDVDFYNNNKL